MQKLGIWEGWKAEKALLNSVGSDRGSSEGVPGWGASKEEDLEVLRGSRSGERFWNQGECRAGIKLGN